MENVNKGDFKGTLILTKEVFNVIFSKIIEQFENTYKIGSNYKETQLFGFGNYNPDKPNLKSDFEELTKGYINGKYLYNKNRESTAGKPFIKISREYKYVFFNYLGYSDIDEFLNQDFILPNQKSKQLETLHQNNNIEDVYYTAYYYGEDKKMGKGQVVIYKQWKNIEMKYVYEDSFGKTAVYSFFGKINFSEGFIFIDSKFYLDSKKYEGAKFTFFIGKSSPHEREYLIGTYTGFDKYENTIAGKMILKKFDSRTEMENEVSNKHFDPIISQELNNERIIVESLIRKNPMLFSPKSPYAQILDKINNTYLVKFYYEDNVFDIKLTLERYHLSIKSSDTSYFIENDQINLISNGQIVNMDFSINGLFHIQKATIYIRSTDLIEFNEDHFGQFTAIDINNKILSGKVSFQIIN